MAYRIFYCIVCSATMSQEVCNTYEETVSVFEYLLQEKNNIYNGTNLSQFIMFLVFEIIKNICVL